MPMYNLKGCNDNCSKTSRSLWQYCEDIPDVNNAVILLILMVLMLLIHVILKQKIHAKLMMME